MAVSSQRKGTELKRIIATLAVTLAFSNADAQTEDLHALSLGASPKDLTVSGVSSGAAMALQFAFANSASVMGVGSIAGPGWGCAQSHVSRAIYDCMCGVHEIEPEIERLLNLSAKKSVDKLNRGKPRALKKAYVFHSPSDKTVVSQSASASIEFLETFLGEKAVIREWGDEAHGTANARHGIISPDGQDQCSIQPGKPTYVLNCGAEDNAGKVLHALYGAPGTNYDPSLRGKTPPLNGNEQLPTWTLRTFNQKAIVEEVQKAFSDEIIASDDYKFELTWMGLIPVPTKTKRRENFDMADKGYFYVPPNCKGNDAKNCRIHVALHGCKQDANVFARTAGYNNWAELYRLIVVYPAVEQISKGTEGICEKPRQDLVQEETFYGPGLDLATYEPNPNGCWDWWGYLDTGLPDPNRYLTKRSPQMEVIKRIVNAVAPEAIQ